MNKYNPLVWYIEETMWKCKMFNPFTSLSALTKRSFFKLTALATALATLGLTACSSTPTPPAKRAMPTTPIIPQAQTQSAPQQGGSAFLDADDIDTETLDRLEELLYATDIRAVEGDRLLILKHGDIWKRLTVGYKMNLDSKQHSRISAQRNWFISRQPYLDRLSARASRYLFYTVREAERRGMPTELALLPIIESSYDPAATSSAAAAGLWQFIPSTGRAYGLSQTSTYDGRRDVVASTQAAYDFLGSLYNQFGSWELALAAYNAGPGTVSKAIKQNQIAGLPTDYWSLRLPRETMDYVPRFIAVAQIVKNPSAYDVTLPPIANRPHFREVQLSRPTDLNYVANVTGLDRAELYALNPGYRGDMIDTSSSMRLLIPADLNPNIDEHLRQGTQYVAKVTPPPMNQTQTTTQKILQKTVSKTTATTPPPSAPTGSANPTNDTLAGLSTLTQGQQPKQILNLPVVTTSNETPSKVADADKMVPVQRTVSTKEREKQLANLLQDEAVHRVATAIPMPTGITTVTGTRVPSTPQPAPKQEPIKINPNRANIDLNSLDTNVSIAEKTGKEITKTFSYPTTVVDKTPNEVTQLNQNKAVARQKDEVVVSTPKGKRSTYTVQTGDSLISIASRYDLNWRDIAEWNKINPTAPLYVGAKLYLYDARSTQGTNTTRPTTYTVKSGESLTGIARQYGLTVQQLADYNGLTVNSNVLVGQKLNLVAPKNAPAKPAQAPSTASNSKASGKIETQSYVVKSGEHLTMIANRYGLTNQELASLTNGVNADTMLQVGQRINVPKTAPKPQLAEPKAIEQPNRHVVQAGETLSGIASKYHLQLNYLADLNGLERTAQVQAGQVLKLTGEVPKTAPVEKKAEPKKAEKAPAPVKATAKTQSYTVQAGESLIGLARREGISTAELAKLNNLDVNANLLVGQRIVIPKKALSTTTYTVKRGDSLIGLAKKYGISTEELAKMNGLKPDASLNLGSTIKVPAK